MKILINIKYRIKYISTLIHVWRNKLYWKKYYKTHRENNLPTSFALFCVDNYIQNEDTILELGCGNGRDSLFFAKQNLKIDAIDIVSEEINYLKVHNNCKNLKFINTDFTKYQKENFYNCVYSRFTIHSITLNQEKDTLINAYRNLQKNGLFCIEVRSIKDEMFKKSTKISKNEGKTDHYRRFIDYDEFINSLKNVGFEIIYSLESKNLAIYKNDNPWVIRVIAKK